MSEDLRDWAQGEHELWAWLQNSITLLTDWKKRFWNNLTNTILQFFRVFISAKII